MFFDVVDDDAVAVDVRVIEGVEDEAGAFEFVLEVGGVDEDGLVELFGDFEVFLEDLEFVFGVFVEADFADAEDVWLVDEVGDEGHDLTGEDGVFGFLGVDAEPAEVLDAELGGAGGLVLGELAVVVEEALGGGAIEAGPEGGFAEGFAADLGDGLVVRGGAADHVGVGLDVFHVLRGVGLDEVEVFIVVKKLDAVAVSASLNLDIGEGDVDAGTDAAAADFGRFLPAFVIEFEGMAEGDEVVEFVVFSFSADAAVEFRPDDGIDGDVAIEDEGGKSGVGFRREDFAKVADAY